MIDMGLAVTQSGDTNDSSKHYGLRTRGNEQPRPLPLRLAANHLRREEALWTAARVQTTVGADSTSSIGAGPTNSCLLASRLATRPCPLAANVLSHVASDGDMARTRLQRGQGYRDKAVDT